MRLGPGPVFVFESLTSARRWQLYATRAAFVMSLLVAMVVIWIAEVADPKLTLAQALAEVGEKYFYALIGTQLALVLLAAPAFTAGAICLDRARGALAHVLVTDLSATEIVLGKLGAGLMPVVGLVVCAFPVMSLGALLGGMDPWAVTMAFLVALAVAILGCVLALTISVWATRTNEVIMAVYAFWTLVLLFHPLWFLLARSGAGIGGPPPWTLKFNPFWLSFSPYLAPNQVSWTDFALFLGGALALSAGLTVVSIVRLRPVTAQLAGRSSGTRKVRSRLGLWARIRRRLPGPSLDGNPVLWREWHRNQSGRLARLLWGVYFAGLAYGGAYVVSEVYVSGVPGATGLGAFVVLLGIGLGLLLLSVTASTSLSEERTRGTLDVLLATPLPTRKIVWGKWWGTFRVVPLLTVWPTVVMAAIAFADSPWPAGSPRRIAYDELSAGTRAFSVVSMALIVLVHGAAITSLGLALATWLRRPGHAAGLCIAACVIVSVGWASLIAIVFDHGPRDGLLLANLSPVFASVNLCEDMIHRPQDVPWDCGSTIFWLHVVAGAAVSFYALTLATFDRCLGRISALDDAFYFGPELSPSGTAWRPAENVLARSDDPAA